MTLKFGPHIRKIPHFTDEAKTTRMESTICLTLIFNLLAELVEDDIAQCEEQSEENDEDVE